MVEDVEMSTKMRTANVQVVEYFIRTYHNLFLDGTTGERCEEIIDFCLTNPNPCVYGKCNSLYNGTFSCECDNGVFGERCDVRI